MPLYEVSITPNQRIKAQDLNLVRWHAAQPPEEPIADAVYAPQLDAIYTNCAKRHKELRAAFQEGIEYWRGVVYMPQTQPKRVVQPEAWQTVTRRKSKPSEATLASQEATPQPTTNGC